MLVSDASKSRESVMHTRTHEEIDHLVDGERAAAVVVEERVQRLELRPHTHTSGSVSAALGSSRGSGRCGAKTERSGGYLQAVRACTSHLLQVQLLHVADDDAG